MREALQRAEDGLRLQRPVSWSKECRLQLRGRRQRCSAGGGNEVKQRGPLGPFWQLCVCVCVFKRERRCRTYLSNSVGFASPCLLLLQVVGGQTSFASLGTLFQGHDLQLRSKVFEDLV